MLITTWWYSLGVTSWDNTKLYCNKKSTVTLKFKKFGSLLFGLGKVFDIFPSFVIALSAPGIFLCVWETRMTCQNNGVRQQHTSFQDSIALQIEVCAIYACSIPEVHKNWSSTPMIALVPTILITIFSLRVYCFRTCICLEPLFCWKWKTWRVTIIRRGCRGWPKI